MKTSSDEVVGRRALFTHAGSGHGQVSAAGDGRHALFSSPSPPGPVIHCSSCDAATPVRPRDLWWKMTPAVHVPFRSHPIRMRCPACRRFSWCRVAWSAQR